MLRDGASVSQHQCPVLCHSMVSLKFAQFSHSSLSHALRPPVSGHRPFSRDRVVDLAGNTVDQDMTC